MINSNAYNKFTRAMVERLSVGRWKRYTPALERNCEEGLYLHAAVPLKAIISISEESDGCLWAHMSVSHQGRIPTWEEFRDAKAVFLGDVWAYQIFPTSDKYVNIHPFVLHAYHKIGFGPVLPDFTRKIEGYNSI